jgi:hypothetical protein
MNFYISSERDAQMCRARVVNWYAAISKNPRTEASYDSHSKCTYSLDVSFKKLKFFQHFSSGLKNHIHTLGLFHDYMSPVDKRESKRNS